MNNPFALGAQTQFETGSPRTAPAAADQVASSPAPGSRPARHAISRAVLTAGVKTERAEIPSRRFNLTPFMTAAENRKCGLSIRFFLPARGTHRGRRTQADVSLDPGERSIFQIANHPPGSRSAYERVNFAQL
jgi:hypothetical protein